MCELLMDIPIPEKFLRASQQTTQCLFQARLDLFDIALVREFEAEEYFSLQYGLSVPSAVFFFL